MSSYTLFKLNLSFFVFYLQLLCICICDCYCFTQYLSLNNALQNIDNNHI